MTTSVTARITAGPVRNRVIGPSGTAYWLSAALAMAAAAGSLLTFTVPEVLRGTVRRGWHPWALAGLDGLTGAAAVYGGAGLIRDGFGMPDGWLAGTPLTGWVLPGVALLIGVAAPQLAAAALILAGAWPGLAAGYLAGLLLVAWIAVQLLILHGTSSCSRSSRASAPPRSCSPGGGSGPRGAAGPGGSSPDRGTQRL